MGQIVDRYASAISSGNLVSKPDTTFSDTDVLGAAGLAGKPVLHGGKPGHPLAIALTRLFCGDARAATDIVNLMSDLAWRRAHRTGVKLKRSQADDVARAVLAYHRSGACKVCGGHGYKLIAGTRTIGDEACPKCVGRGKIDFDGQFSERLRPIARWLCAQIEEEQARAGPAAMAALASRWDEAHNSSTRQSG